MRLLLWAQHTVRLYKSVVLSVTRAHYALLVITNGVDGNYVVSADIGADGQLVCVHQGTH